MNRTCFAIPILLCILFIGSDPVSCRRYDIETEAMKLFGEDLKVVLKRFRRTPEYMAILNEKVVELKSNFDDMLKQVSSAFKVKMEKHIQRTMDKEQKDKKTYHMHGRYRPGRRQHPQDVGLQAEATTLSPVEQLDSMVPGNNQLTAAESNHYRDQGFKFAGDAIHHMIRNMGPDADDVAPKSTRSPDDTAPTTTEHVKVHEVSTRVLEIHEEETRTPDPMTSEPDAVSGPQSEVQPDPPKYVRHAYERDHRDKGLHDKTHRHKGLHSQPGDTDRLRAVSDKGPSEKRVRGKWRDKGVRIKGPHDMNPYVKDLKHSESHVKRDALINPYLLPEKKIHN